MNIYYILFTIAIALLLAVLALRANVAHEVREEKKAMRKKLPTGWAVALLILLASCSTTARQKHFERVRPNGYWTLKGYHPPAGANPDTVIITIVTKKKEWN